LNQILKRQTSRSHYGSKVPAVTVTVLHYFPFLLKKKCSGMTTFRYFKTYIYIVFYHGVALYAKYCTTSGSEGVKLSHKVSTRGKKNIHIWLTIIISILIGKLRKHFKSKRSWLSSARSGYDSEIIRVISYTINNMVPGLARAMNRTTDFNIIFS
jgi:hypothetical protein